MLFCVLFASAQELKTFTVNLTVVGIDSTYKLITATDGVTPMYWKFRVPDSKWQRVAKAVRLEDVAEITYKGFELSDPLSISETYVPVVSGLLVYRPSRVF